MLFTLKKNLCDSYEMYKFGHIIEDEYYNHQQRKIIA